MVATQLRNISSKSLPRAQKPPIKIQLSSLGIFVHHWDTNMCLTDGSLKSWEPKCHYVKKYNTRLCQVGFVLGTVNSVNWGEVSKEGKKVTKCDFTHKIEEKINYKSKKYICNTYHQQRISTEDIQRTTISL